jgi:hypothetical protein
VKHELRLNFQCSKPALSDFFPYGNIPSLAETGNVKIYENLASGFVLEYFLTRNRISAGSLK